MEGLMLALRFILEVYPSAEEGVCSGPPPPGAAHERCCSVVKVRQADILLSHTHPPQSGAYQPRTGLAPPAWASSFVPVGASQRLTGWWMAAAESDLEKTLGRVVQTPKGVRRWMFFFLLLLIFESLFKLNQRECTETAFMFPHSADERVF